MRLRALFLASLAVSTTPAFAQETAGAAEAETIIVTGTRRLDRTLADSPVPVDVVTLSSIQNSGTTETARALRDLVPSFSFPQPSLTDGTDVIRPASLRGLGPDQTLVLLNGKRRHLSALLNLNGSVGRGSQAVDINFIPASALSRVEVLRDGAAAQYGSDAIAGVINFQLNDAREGGRFSVTYGANVTDIAGVNRQGGPVLQNGAPVLTPDGVLTLEDSGRKLHQTDGETVTVTGNIGLPLGAEGFVNISGEYRSRQATNRAGYDPRQQYGLNIAAFDTAKEGAFDRRSHRFGDPKTEDGLISVNIGIPLDDRVDAYAFGTWGKRHGESAGFYRRAQQNNNVAAIYPDGYLPLITSETDDLALTGGLKGDFGGWSWDLSMQFGRNKLDYTIKDTVNVSLGANSPTEFDAGGLTYTQWVNNLDISRDLDFFERTTLSFGLEYRRETFKVTAGEPDSYRWAGGSVCEANPIYCGSAAGNAGAAPGSQVFPGFQPVIGGVSVTGTNARENVSAYAELDLDLLPIWNLQLAGRFEDYSDFGSDWNWKAATRFEILDWLAVRGSASTGFRAPGVAQQYYAAASTIITNGNLLDTVTLPVGNPVAQALGASPLKAETAVNWSAGVTAAPLSGLNFTFDYYEIRIDDRIVLTENMAATRDVAGNPTGSNPGRGIAEILNAAGYNTISAARFFINGIDTKTRGFDAILTYRHDFGNLGNALFTLGYNWNKTEITDYKAAPGAFNQVPGITLFGRQESLRITEGTPRNKLNIGIDYDREWLGVTFRGNRYGKVLSPGSEAFNDVEIRPAFVADAEIRARPSGFLNGVELAVGANNLFDKYPTRVPTGQGQDPVTDATRNYAVSNYFLPYSSFSPFGFNGRYIYGRVSYRF
ncbi:TonB-dependent receptor [Sandaracinobacter sp. RS1-74]|uniref:TonB-dependent receptor plug domain-containing protein n=1 Tax=Sandaracinobacteroides sayramensis TaxID=2913411 RepID=UPI001EDA7383|nr:TonB-dependent receptor [Sandaracinobacteroides sayramensis]MCG2842096.1 TonB-dependent receptor [Sandaracinobacteroides sayramensis]